MHFARGQPSHQDLAHEILRAHRGHARIEAQQADEIGAEAAQALEFRPRQLQARRRRGRREEFARQRLEAQRDRRHAQRARARDRMAHQRAMAQVQAVEGADADHTAVGAQGPAFDVAEQPVHGFSIGSARPCLDGRFVI